MVLDEARHIGFNLRLHEDRIEVGGWIEYLRKTIEPGVDRVAAQKVAQNPVK
jgi:hypothetical protein